MNLPLLLYLAGAFVLLIAVGLYVAPLLEKFAWNMQERERGLRDEQQTRAFMRQQHRERLPSHLGTAGVDMQLEGMREHGQRREALKLAQERLRLAHEQGDRGREERYRRYVAEFSGDAPPPPPPLQ